MTQITIKKFKMLKNLIAWQSPLKLSHRGMKNIVMMHHDDNKLFKHIKKPERVRKADHRNAVRVAVV